MTLLLPFPNCLLNLRHFSSRHFTSSCEVPRLRRAMFNDLRVLPYLAHVYFFFLILGRLRQKSRAWPCCNVRVPICTLFMHKIPQRFSCPSCQLDPLIRVCNVPPLPVQAAPAWSPQSRNKTLKSRDFVLVLVSSSDRRVNSVDVHMKE